MSKHTHDGKKKSNPKNLKKKSKQIETKPDKFPPCTASLQSL